MTAITIIDLENAKLDVDHIAAIATSTAPTATDRLGNVKKTMSGASADVVAKIALVETAKNTAINTTIPTSVAAVDAAKNTAITTTIPAKIAAIDTVVINATATIARNLGAAAIAPLVRDNGGALQTGDYYFNTGSNATFVRAGGGVWGMVTGATAADLANAADTAKGAALVGYNNASVAQRLDRMLHIEGENYRDFWNALAAYNLSEDGNVTIGSFGDSVSADLAIAFADHWAREIGFLNPSSFTPVAMANALVTPTGVEPVARWPGVTLPFTLAGGATYNAYADGAVPDPVYVPNSDQRWIIPVGGSVVWGTALATGYQRMLVFLAIEPGAGTCTVDVLDQTNAVIATQVINCANATLGATKADFTGLDTTKTLKIRVTSTSGTVTALGAVNMFRRGVTLLAWQWGGSTYIQQCKSSKVIFDYINNSLATSIVFAECKGETSTDGVVGGVDGLALACARLNALSASKVFIGSRPDSGAEAGQYDQIWRFRDYAVANDYVFVDGYNMLKNYAELQRLQWDRRNNVIETVHLPVITAYYVAGFLIARMPKGFIKNLWHTRKVFSKKVSASSLNIILQGRSNDEPNSLPVIIPYPNDPTVLLSKVQNVASYKIKNPYSTDTCEITMYGSECNFDKGVRAVSYDQNGTGVNLFYGENRNASAINQNTFTGTSNWTGGLSLGRPMIVPSFTVAALPGSSTGGMAFATNGRKVGEGAGAGTGVPVYCVGGIWRVFSTDAAVAA